MSEINNRVMRRVRVVYFIRKATGQLMLKIYILGGLGVLETYYISFGQVASNLQNGVDGPRSAFGFAISAFSKTERVSLLLLIASATLVVLTVRDMTPVARLSDLVQTWRPRLSRRERVVV